MTADGQSLDANLGIAGYRFTRFEYAAAPRRIDIDPALQGKLDLG